MPPVVASAVFVVGILGLLWLDRGRPSSVSRAIWIPIIWMFIAGSRFVSQWLNLGPVEVSADGYSDGSPLDRNIFLALILSGLWALHQRRVDWLDLLKRNAWIVLLFAYAAVSVAWSDDPMMSMKRWIKGIGNPIMALIIITEKRPDEALGYLMRRLAIVLLPLSVLFIKYYPELGRGYHMGRPLHQGATYGKNALGQLCLIVGVYFAWFVIHGRRRPGGEFRPVHPAVLISLTAMLAWLLFMADSATSLACLVAALLVFGLARTPGFARNPKKVVDVAMAVTMAYFALDAIFDLKSIAIQMLGRRPDLTDRDVIWATVLALQERAWVGAGYENFWTGGRLLLIWERIGVPGINQAHNGYIEYYLNQGVIGLSILALCIVAGLRRVRGQLEQEFEFAVLKLAYLVVVLMYNYTEAMFTPVSNLFVLIMVAVMAWPAKHDQKEAVAVGTDQRRTVRFARLHVPVRRRLPYGRKAR